MITIKSLIEELRNELHNEILNDELINHLCYNLKKRVSNKSKYPKNINEIKTGSLGGRTPVYTFFQPYEASDSRLFIKKASELFKTQLNTTPRKFLDVGSGLGHITELANQLELETYGIELSQGLLRYAKRISPNTTFIKDNILTYDKYNGYDIIWCFNPCNGGEIEVITKQITNPCIIISLNSYIQTLPIGWNKFNLGENGWSGKAIKNF